MATSACTHPPSTPLSTTKTVPADGRTDVRLSVGVVRGVVDDGLRVFKGIPYAEAPIGEQRLEPAVASGPWHEPLDASRFGPSCPQDLAGLGWALGDEANVFSEDCLSLNVWAHDDVDNAPAKKRPVMVFIYGGGFIVGGSSWPTYDMAELAREGDVVAVSLNYRLGALGYLALPSSTNGIQANLGLQDQLLALQWVQDNIAAFGGDPANVTLFGESAGAISVCALLGVPDADPLFHKAILQSGLCMLGDARPDGKGLLGQTPPRDIAQRLIRELGCDPDDAPKRCLQKKDVDDTLGLLSFRDVVSGDLSKLNGLSPVVDGQVLPEQPHLRLARGDVNKPLLLGTNRDEGKLFTSADIVWSRDQLDSHLKAYVVDDAHRAKLMQLYDEKSFPSPKDAWVAFMSEVVFICPTMKTTQAASAHMPVFSYHFTHTPTSLDLIGPAHAVELPFVFGTFDSMRIAPDDDDQALHTFMRQAWTSFAHHGAPQTQPEWPAFSSSSPHVMRLRLPTKASTTAVRGGRCAALSELGLVP